MKAVSPTFKKNICVFSCALAFVLLMTLVVVMTGRSKVHDESDGLMPESSKVYDISDDPVTASTKEHDISDSIMTENVPDRDTSGTYESLCESSYIEETSSQSLDSTETAGTTEQESIQTEPEGGQPALSVTVPETNVAPSPVIMSGETSKGFRLEEIDGLTYVDGLLIVNKTYSLPESYNPGGLTPETYGAFAAMQADAAAQGIYLRCISGFRSFADQRYIYNSYVARDGAEAADTYSARPGHSEHQSGMAIDVNSLYFSFADTAEGKWLAENCVRYGFIIRYPKDKTDVTGYVYEPWHIRYVGRERAEAIAGSGLTLEEYYGIASSYGD